MVIFDCNGVLVDSEPIVSAVLAESLTRAGFPANADGLARRYHGRRPADVFASVEAATGKKLPPNFASGVSVETVRRFRTELPVCDPSELVVHERHQLVHCAGRTLSQRD